MNAYPLPHLSGDDSAKLRQLYSYLYRLAEQLNNADASVDATAALRQAAVPSAQKSPAEQFSAIKSLIIQSADVVNAYCEAIEKRLQGKFVAQSDFGTYREDTAATLSANARELAVLFESTEAIESLLAEVEGGISKIYARLRAGLLYHDENGQAVYGLEIGQRGIVGNSEVFSKFARFTADRLSFYDRNEVEVAYISDYKLYVTSAEIKASLRVGGFLIDARDGLSFRWCG